MFIRGWDNGSGNDPGAVGRYSPYITQQYVGDFIGTYEVYLNEEHNHTGTVGTSSNTSSGPYVQFSNATVGDIDLTIGYQGGVESRPINISLNYVIKY